MSIRVLLGMFIVLVSTACIAQSKIIVGITDANRSALTYDGEKFAGSLADLYQCPFMYMTDQFDFQLMPQARLLSYLQSGDIAVGLPLTRNDQRDEYAGSTLPILSANHLVFSKQELSFTQGLADKRFATLRNSQNKIFIERFDAQTIEVESYQQAALMTQASRVDGFVLPEVVAKAFSQQELEGLTSQVIGQSIAGMYVSYRHSNSAALLRQINAAIVKCKDTQASNQ